MRKILISAAALGLCLMALGRGKQPLNLPYTEDGHIQYREIVKVSGIPTAELMKRARAWVAATYRSAPDVIKYQTKDELMVKGLMVIRDWKVWHVLTIQAKDGEYRVTISGFEVEWGPGRFTALDSSGYQKARNVPRYGYRPLFIGVDKEAQGTLASLKIAMAKPAENW